MNVIEIPVPKEFNFELSLQYLERSPKELLHRCTDDRVIKYYQKESSRILFSVRYRTHALLVEFLNEVPSPVEKQEIIQYVREWFDLDTNLKPFYSLVRKDKVLKELVKKYFGYRIVGQPDLFESLVWAVLGQQINLQFAYTLKGRFVEAFGESLDFENNRYHLFPTAEKVSKLQHDQLLSLQFSRQKASYTIGIAQAFVEHRVSKQKLKVMTLDEAKKELMTIKGVGNWTANYALMKTFRHPNAFPLEDAGLHNAIKNRLGLRAKPSLDRVKKLFRNYRGWEAYATLYLWKSL